MGTIGFDFGSNLWATSAYTTASTDAYLTTYAYPTVEYSSGNYTGDDEDERSDNEKWLDNRVDEMRVKW